MADHTQTYTTSTTEHLQRRFLGIRELVSIDSIYQNPYSICIGQMADPMVGYAHHMKEGHCNVRYQKFRQLVL